MNRSNLVASVECIADIAGMITEELSAARWNAQVERAAWQLLYAWFEDEGGIWFADWRYDLATDCFVIREGQLSEWDVPAHQVATIDGLCRTIYHLAAKDWATPPVLRELVRCVAFHQEATERHDACQM